MKYRKITFEEIQKIALLIKYWGDIPVEEICENVIDFYGENAATVFLHFGDEYNDETYNLRLTNLTVLDGSGKEILPDYIKKEDYKNKKYDQWCDWKYGIQIGDESNDGDRELGEIKINVKTKEILTENGQMPELYIKE